MRAKAWCTVTWILHFLVGSVAVFIGLHRTALRQHAFKAAWASIAVALLVVFSLHAERAIAQNSAVPPIWDFRCFWVYGRVADVTHEPYNPHAMHTIGDALPYDRGFSREVLDVGMVYPPPSVALFAPLGLFETPKRALPFWYAILIGALLLDTMLLWRIFLRDAGIAGLLAAAVLVAVFPGTLEVIRAAQSVFVALAFVLLYLDARKPLRQGAFLALAVIVKPFVLVTLLYPLLRRDWRTLLSAVVTSLVLTAAVVPLIGWHSIASFITDSPEQRLPSTILTAYSNQSILGWVERVTQQQDSISAALHNPLYLVAVVLLLAATVALVAKFGEHERAYCIALLISLSLLIYPHDQFFYTPMLLIPIAFVWSRRSVLLGGAVTAWAFTFVEFALSNPFNMQMFAALASWIMLACLPPLQRLPSRVIASEAERVQLMIP